MQKWKIDGRLQYLCEECAKANAHIFLMYPHSWLGREDGGEAACDCCRCRDAVVNRLGRLGWMRWLLYPVLCLMPRPSLTVADSRSGE